MRIKDLNNDTHVKKDKSMRETILIIISTTLSPIISIFIGIIAQYLMLYINFFIKYIGFFGKGAIFVEVIATGYFSSNFISKVFNPKKEISSFIFAVIVIIIGVFYIFMSISEHKTIEYIIIVTALVILYGAAGVLGFLGD